MCSINPVCDESATLFFHSFCLHEKKRTGFTELELVLVLVQHRKERTGFAVDRHDLSQRGAEVILELCLLGEVNDDLVLPPAHGEYRGGVGPVKAALSPDLACGSWCLNVSGSCCLNTAREGRATPRPRLREVGEVSA